MSIFCLKIIATVCMLLDHIAYFFPDMPIQFHWLGRLSAPIFVFCVVNSMEYTHSQHKYMLRLYIFSIVVAIFQIFSYIELNIIRTLFTISLLIYIFEKRFTDIRKCKKMIVTYILYQIITCIICELLIIYSTPNANENFFVYLFPTLLGNILGMEGGLIWVFVGLLFYFFKKNRSKLAISYTLMVILYEVCLATHYVYSVIFRIGYIPLIGYNLEELLLFVFAAIIGFDPISSGGNIFFEQYQWMIIFSLPLILCYNQKKGLKIKYGFYVFYILHIFILWWLTK